LWQSQSTLGNRRNHQNEMFSGKLMIMTFVFNMFSAMFIRNNITNEHGQLHTNTILRIHTKYIPIQYYEYMNKIHVMYLSLSYRMQRLCRRVACHLQKRHFQTRFLIGCSDNLADVDVRFRLIWAIWLAPGSDYSGSDLEPCRSIVPATTSV